MLTLSTSGCHGDIPRCTNGLHGQCLAENAKKTEGCKGSGSNTGIFAKFYKSRYFTLFTLGKPGPSGDLGLSDKPICAGCSSRCIIRFPRPFGFFGICPIARTERFKVLLFAGPGLSLSQYSFPLQQRLLIIRVMYKSCSTSRQVFVRHSL